MRRLLLAVVLFGLCGARALAIPITHVVLIIQENRTVDNLFQQMPGLNTQNYCMVGAVHTNLTPTTLPANDYNHGHSGFVNDYNGGANNGWNAPQCAYIPQSQVQPYYTFGETYTFLDKMFQTNQGPSFPAHQYLLSGTSQVSPGSDLAFAENTTPTSKSGCDAPVGTTVELISLSTGVESGTAFPCRTGGSIVGEMLATSQTVRMYQAASGAGFWKSLDAVQDLWCLPASAPCYPSGPGTGYLALLSYPSLNIINDVQSHTLQSLSIVTPNNAQSDHGGQTDGSGPSYVTAIINAIGNSSYWSSTAIIVTWDDWGGWFDHVAPTSFPNGYEMGYRVPCIIISPYARLAHISENPYDFGSILLYIEGVFGLPSLGTADSRANDFTSDAFNYLQAPTPYNQVTVPLTPAFLFAQERAHPDAPGSVPDDDSVSLTDSDCGTRTCLDYTMAAALSIDRR